MAIHSKEFIISRPSYLGGGNWILDNLSDITVLFGRNGSGKSLLLRALRDQDKESHHYASPERGGEISLNPSFATEEFNAETRANRRNRNLAPTYREEVISRIQTFLAKRGDVRLGSIQENPDEIEQMLNILLPDFQFKIVSSKNPPYELKRIINEEIVSSVNSLSSGESEILTLALDLLTICAIWALDNRQKRILLIDSPDPHLHPDLQQQLANFLVKTMERYKTQIIVATHSTTLLSALGHYGSNRTSVIYMDNSKEKQKAIPFDRTLIELATCLGGHALMGPLFSFPLLLVEGDDDYKIWSQAVRHHRLKLSAIPCNGDEINNYRRTLKKIFEAILGKADKPSAYVLRDRDVQDSESTQRLLGNIQVKTIKLVCRESENLYLTDEVLTKIGITTWDQAKEKINSNSSNFGQKQQRLSGITSTDRKTVDLKNLMEELTQILDPKKVDWRIRIGQCIGEKKPEGQLKEFLGDDVISSFWPDDN